MAAAIRLVTLLDVEDDAADARQMSVSVRHEAVLADGRRLLLGDRGWTSRAVGSADIWSETSMEEIENTARAVVGPDEPFDGRSQEDMQADHWAYLEDVLRQQGVIVNAAVLQQLPHDVVLGQRLLGRLRRH